MCAWRSAVPPSARSAPASPNWWGRARAPTGRATTRPSPRSRASGRNWSPGRAGSEKPRSARPRSVPVMNISVRNMFLEVDDHEAALAFYRDALGFEVRQDVAMEGARWLTVGPASQPGFGVVLSTVGVGRPPEDAQALRELLAKGSLAGLVLETGDVDATFESIRATGAEVLQEPMDQPYGTRDCAFRDPSGNQVRIN